MNKAITSLAGVVALAGVISLALHFSGVPDAITTAIVTGIFVLYPTLVTTLAQREKTKQERIQELVKGNIQIHPVLAAFYVLCYLQFIERTIGFVFGAAIGMALGMSGQTAQTIQRVVIEVGPLFVVLLAMFAIVPIAKYTTHRVKRFPFLWIAGAIVFDQMITIAVFALIFKVSITRLILPQALVALLLFPGAIIGYLWAKKTYSAYIMAHLFRQLSQPDQKSIIDLVQTLPGTSTAR